jgi:CBS domain-containing protein
MNIKDVMTTNPRYCVPGDTSTHAARIMKDKNVGIVPIIASDIDHKLIGVVTDRDLCLAIVAQNVQPDSVQVRQCMTTPIVTVWPEDDVQKALALMSENQVRRIPVVNEDGMLEGMVATADIVQRASVSSDKMYDAFKKISEPTEQASKPRAKMNQKVA